MLYDSLAPILVASKAAGIRVIDVRDEASAAFAADAGRRAYDGGMRSLL